MNLTAALWHFQRGQERKAFIRFLSNLRNLYLTCWCVSKLVHVFPWRNVSNADKRCNPPLCISFNAICILWLLDMQERTRSCDPASSSWSDVLCQHGNNNLRCETVTFWLGLHIKSVTASRPGSRLRQTRETRLIYKLWTSIFIYKIIVI